MKKTFLYILSAVIAVLSFSACAGENEPIVNGASFEIQSFDNFLWKKDAVDTVKFSINTEFVECENVRRPLVLALCDSDGKIISQEKAALFVNGKKSSDNKVKVNVSNGKQIADLGVVVNAALLDDDATFNWHIMLCDDAGLSKIYSEHSDGVRSLVLDDEKWVYGLDVQIKNKHVANSLKVWTNIIFWVILIALVTWIVLAHFVMWPSTRFSKVMIDYHDGVGPRPIRMSGCYQLVLTDNPRMKDSFLKKIFKGSCRYEVNEFWTHPVIIKNSAARNSVRVNNLRTFYLNGETLRKQEFEIINENDSKVTIITT